MNKNPNYNDYIRYLEDEAFKHDYDNEEELNKLKEIKNLNEVFMPSIQIPLNDLEKMSDEEAIEKLSIIFKKK